MAENLKKTILIEDKEYNINAVYSDEAGKVTTPLVIKESGIKVGEYYGSTDTSETTRSEINYVPATGGTFTGPVNIYTDKTDVTGVTDSEIINYGQVDHIVSKLTGAPLYTWDINTGYNAKTDSTGADYKLNIVIGTVEDLPIFEAYSEGKAHSKYIAPDNADKNHVSYDTTKSTEYVVAYFTPIYNQDKNTITKLVIPGTYSSPDETIKDRPIKIDKYSNEIPAFQELTALETVYINPGVTEIGQTAFLGCTALKSIAIPDSVTSIGDWAFENCTSLTTVILGSKITEIQSGTFKNSGLKNIFIGSNVTRIYSNAFLGTQLEKVYFAGTKEAWNTIKDESGNANPLLEISVICIDDANHPAAPFLYICDDGEIDTSLTSNKMFLKLPGEALIEVSKGAVRLARPGLVSNSNYKYYTYDTLAAILAGINSRLTALGSTALALPTTLTVPIGETETSHILVPDLDTDEEEQTTLFKGIIEKNANVLVEETVVPSVQELQDAIINIANSLNAEQGINKDQVTITDETTGKTTTTATFKLADDFYNYLTEQIYGQAPTVHLSYVKFEPHQKYGVGISYMTSPNFEVGTPLQCIQIRHYETNIDNFSQDTKLTLSLIGPDDENITISNDIDPITQSNSTSILKFSEINYTPTNKGTITLKLSGERIVAGEKVDISDEQSYEVYCPVFYKVISDEMLTNLKASGYVLNVDDLTLNNGKYAFFGKKAFIILDNSMCSFTVSEQARHLLFLSTDDIELSNGGISIEPQVSGTVNVNVNGYTIPYNYKVITNCESGTHTVTVKTPTV